MGLKKYTHIKVKEGREVVFLDSLGYPSGSFKDKVRSYCNAFLNSHGGILYFGCRSDGCIYGGNITRKMEDEYRLAFDSVVRNFVPFVPVDKYRLSFLFIDNEKDLAIIEIKVSIGDIGEIYEDGLNNVFIVDCGSLVGPLYPQELRELILLKYKESVEGAEEAKKFFTPNIIQAREKAKLTAQKRKLEPIAEESAEKVPTVNIVKIKRGFNKEIVDLTQSREIFKSSESVLSLEVTTSQAINNSSKNTEIKPLQLPISPNKTKNSVVSQVTMKSSSSLPIQAIKPSVPIQAIKPSVPLTSNPISRFVNSKVVTRRPISYFEDFF